jgi:hypothetical protein
VGERQGKMLVEKLEEEKETCVGFKIDFFVVCGCFLWENAKGPMICFDILHW